MKTTMKLIGLLYLVPLLVSGCGGSGSGVVQQSGDSATLDAIQNPSGTTARFSSAVAINDDGLVIGFAETAANSEFHAALWTVRGDGSAASAPSRLYPIDGNAFSAAFALDQHGNTVGVSAKGAQLAAVIWPAGTNLPQELPPLTANGSSTAYGVSADGKWIAGQAENANSITRAVVWAADSNGNFTVPTILPVNIFVKNGASSPFSAAYGVARVGTEIWVVGEAEDGEEVSHAALWYSADGIVFTPVDLRRGSEKGSAAFAVNSSGKIVGESEASTGVFAPAVWGRSGGEFKRTDLGAAGGASSINEAGNIAGWETSDSTDLATVWTESGKKSLFSVQSQAYGINSSNLVVGRKGLVGFVKKVQ